MKIERIDTLLEYAWVNRVNPEYSLAQSTLAIAYMMRAGYKDPESGPMDVRGVQYDQL